MTCRACDLCITRTNIVLGYGNEKAEIMLIGEAPGYHEDKTSIPFTGKSGTYLMNLLSKIDINKDNTFITNVVKCRPPRNRTPDAIEINTCINLYLGNEINYVNPIFIITVGVVATNVMLGETTMKAAVGNYYKVDNRYVIPIYHPAYILRNQHLSDAYIELIHFVRETINNIAFIDAFEIAAIFNKETKSPF